MASSRFHTAGRRQPELIGKDTSGRPLPGGPYTVPQLLTFGVVFIALMLTSRVWAGGHSGLFTSGVALAVGVGAGFFVKHLDFGGQNPLMIAWGYLGGLEGSRPPGAVRTTAKRQTGRRVDLHASGGATTQAIDPTPDPSPAAVEHSVPGELAAAQHPDVVSVQPQLRLVPDRGQTPATTPSMSALEQFLAAAERTH